MSLASIAKEVASCAKCVLSKTRTHTVPGVGPEKAVVMFIGEGPGQHEDEQGIPFCGAAGKYLDELLQIAGLERNEVFIGNVVKCRPPNNRDPFPKEVEACWPYLAEQIKTIKPKLIVTLGRHAMERFIPGYKISAVHGQPKRRKGQVFYPLYHPAAALYHGGMRVPLEADFKKLPQVLAKVDELKESKKEETKKPLTPKVPENKQKQLGL